LKLTLDGVFGVPWLLGFIRSLSLSLPLDSVWLFFLKKKKKKRKERKKERKKDNILCLAL